MADKVSELIMQKGKDIRTLEVYFLENAHRGYEEELGTLNTHHWVVYNADGGDERFARCINIGEMFIEKRILQNEGFKVIIDNINKEIKEIAQKEMCVIGLK